MRILVHAGQTREDAAVIARSSSSSDVIRRRFELHTLCENIESFYSVTKNHEHAVRVPYKTYGMNAEKNLHSSNRIAVYTISYPSRRPHR